MKHFVEGTLILDRVTESLTILKKVMRPFKLQMARTQNIHCNEDAFIHSWKFSG